MEVKYGGGVEIDPVAIDLNVDAALVLQSIVGIDSYPLVLGLLPNICYPEDRARVHEVVLDELVAAGIVEDGLVHPSVVHWLECLYRPDVELLAYIVAAGEDGTTDAVLRFSLVRAGDTHVLAVRDDDHVVIQSLFYEDQQLNTLAAALTAALGPHPALRFEPVTAPQEQFATIATEDPERARQALLELRADGLTARLLSTMIGRTYRRAEVSMVEHHDGDTGLPDLGLAVLDTPSGRIVVTPTVGLDGRRWLTYGPGDDAGLRAAIGSLVQLLPGRSWFDTARTD